MKLTSALNGSTFERMDDGNVLVTEAGGRTGIFTPDGRHLEGDVRFADPHMIDWLGMPQAQGLGRMAQAMQASEG